MQICEASSTLRIQRPNILHSTVALFRGQRNINYVCTNKFGRGAFRRVFRFIALAHTHTQRVYILSRIVQLHLYSDSAVHYLRRTYAKSITR